MTGSENWLDSRTLFEGASSYRSLQVQFLGLDLSAGAGLVRQARVTKLFKICSFDSESVSLGGVLMLQRSRVPLGAVPEGAGDRRAEERYAGGKNG